MASEWTPDNPWPKDLWDKWLAQLEEDTVAWEADVLAALQSNELAAVVNRDAPQPPQPTPIRRRTPPRKRERRSKR